jgi:hypothetical protein
LLTAPLLTPNTASHYLLKVSKASTKVAPRSEPENALQDRETTGDAPVDQIMDARGRTWAEEPTAVPKVIHLVIQADDFIEQLQAWFTQEIRRCKR